MKSCDVNHKACYVTDMLPRAGGSKPVDPQINAPDGARLLVGPLKIFLKASGPADKKRSPFLHLPARLQRPRRRNLGGNALQDC